MENQNKLTVRTRAIIFYEGKILVVRHSQGQDFYALPGGHLDWGESVHECMKREIVEELGIEPQIGRLLYVNNFTENGTIQSIEFFFEIINAGDYLDTDKLGGTHIHEIAEMCWIGKHDSRKILPEEIQMHLNEEKLISDKVRFL